MKRGKMLGGKPIRRGGRLTSPSQDRMAGSEPRSQLLVVLIGAILVLALVGGYFWTLNRQLVEGLIAQHGEARVRPDWMEIESLPPLAPAAFRLVVDPSFPRRGTGLHPERTSIPEDLVRQVHLLGPGIGARAKQKLMAPLLDVHFTPEEVLELYLNRVNMGETDEGPVYGLRYAAVEYLGKGPGDLTVGEIATLAGLLLEPRLHRPEDTPGAAGVRRNEVLRGLYFEGIITEEQVRAALIEPLGFQPGLAEMPMTLRIPSAQDTVVTRFTVPVEPE